MTGAEVLSSALKLIGEPSTTEYEERSVGLLNQLIAEAWTATTAYNTAPSPEGRSEFVPILSLTDEIADIDKVILYAAMPYGLAALLFLDEDASRASSWWNIWEQNLSAARTICPYDFEEITDVYGTTNGVCYSRW